MKEIGKILLYLLAVVVIGALIAPPLYWLGQAALHYGTRHGMVAFHDEHGQAVATGALAFLSQKFRRYFDRAILVAACALLWPLARSLKIGSWNDLGLQRDPAWRWHFAFGLLVSIASVAGLCAVAVGFGHYSFVQPIPWGKIALLPLSALVVAGIEESLFRGAIQGAVRRAGSDVAAIIFVSALYAVVHFLKPPENAAPPMQITWGSGFAQALLALRQFGELRLVFGGLVTLFMVGVILGYARTRTRSLWMPVGLHSGWIIAKMGFNKIAHSRGEAWPWFGPDLLTGLASVLAVLAAGLVVWWRLRRSGLK